MVSCSGLDPLALVICPDNCSVWRAAIELVCTGDIVHAREPFSPAPDPQGEADGQEDGEAELEEGVEDGLVEAAEEAAAETAKPQGPEPVPELTVMHRANSPDLLVPSNAIGMPQHRYAGLLRGMSLSPSFSMSTFRHCLVNI